MTRQELKFYIEADLIMNGHDRRDKGFYSRLKTLFKPDIILLYLKTLRMVEFYESRACFKTRKLCAKCQYGKLII